MARADWYRLDNVGKFYAAQAGSSAQTVFRFSAAMADAVDAEALQAALDGTVALFPSFNVCLRSGLFWHYLEPSREAPQVQPEVLPICFGLHTGPRSVLFRVSWHERRINLEVSHMISDGRGSLEFFRVLVGLYAQARYGAPCEDVGDDAAALEARRHQADIGRGIVEATGLVDDGDAVQPHMLPCHRLPELRIDAKTLAHGHLQCSAQFGIDHPAVETGPQQDAEIAH